MKTLWLATGLIALLGPASASDPSLASPELTAAEVLAPWSRIVKTYVRDGKVDYAGIKKNEAATIREFRDRLSRFPAETLGTSETGFAFWVNLYNALVVFDLTDRFPVTSPRAIPQFFNRRTHDIGGKFYSLNDVEDHVLRKRFADPRMHFALVCGAKGCPVLELLTPEQIEEELNHAASQFVSDPRNVRFDTQRNVLHLSSIFQWFEADFVPKYGSVRGFLLNYLPSDKADLLRGGKFRIEYDPYDWELNAR